MLSLVLRSLLLLSTAVVAGSGLLRPIAKQTTKRTSLVVWAASAVAAIVDVVTAFIQPVNLPVAILQLVLILALPVLLRWPRAAAWAGFGLTLLLLTETTLAHTGVEFVADTIFTVGVVAWLGVALLSLTAVPSTEEGTPRPGPTTLIIGIALIVAGVLRLVFAGIGFDRRLYTTGFGLLLLAVVVLPIVVTALAWWLLRTDPGKRKRAYSAGAGVVLLSFLAWSTLAVLPPPPPLPQPGVPLVRQLSLAGRQLPVLVTPQRPGANLVHFPVSAGQNLTVTAADGAAVPATERPGAEGTWAEVTLPPGRSDIKISRAGAGQSLGVDTGHEPALASAVGADGPECASAALGEVLAGGRTVLNHCPSEALSPQDAQSLRSLVGFLSSRSAPGITVVADNSPRSQQALHTVQASAAADHLPVSTTPSPNNALVVLSGWPDASSELHSVSSQQRVKQIYSYGLYLAPWLLYAPLVDTTLNSFLPLPFDPRANSALNYAVALQNGFGGENPSPAGFEQWSAAQGEQVGNSVAIYASAQVSAMPMNTASDAATMDPSSRYPGQWITDGTVVPITAPLSPDGKE